MVSLYWGGAMIDRFVGSVVLRVVSPGLVLACVAVGSISLIAISANSAGTLTPLSLLAVALMNSIMFPTIFSFACEKLGPSAADVSGIINVAICGGKVIPLLTGALADASGSLSVSLVLPAVCYAIIAGFGMFASKPAERRRLSLKMAGTPPHTRGAPRSRDRCSTSSGMANRPPKRLRAHWTLVDSD